ncbi:MAG: aldehyde dehydrogenase (NADP(+)) [Sphingobacteriales bacterium]|nr:MAG: aldehyde dehydrogenase (NADP(+)) [Sphingobacteriales bacterium]TAF81881.1 MAG: aldehyde dehydrogenase (NADP(+)) [Sphingobacteriales bacterium]
MQSQFTEANTHDIDQIMQLSFAAYEAYQSQTCQQKAVFLDEIATQIDILGDDLINLASSETNLPYPRLKGERDRTTSGLRMFADMLREGSWVDASIDTTQPDRLPMAKPDIRKMLFPLGPIVVFGASNFPFAYSTAGGDTASALAAGCSVVVKAHPAHAQTSEMVFGAIKTAIEICEMPEHIFMHLHSSSFDVGKALVQHPATAAVGFTGSYIGGKALFDYSAERKHPIPVFSEMGSVNPVLFLPETLKENAAQLATQFSASITGSMGQFCTNPGVMIGIDSAELDHFLDLLCAEVNQVLPAKMLHQGIYNSFNTHREKALNQSDVVLITDENHPTQNLEAMPSIATVSGIEFLENPVLHEEIFGPYSLMVICQNKTELIAVWKALTGQLTTTLIGTDVDFENHLDLILLAKTIAGRVIFNGVPTGVEVCASMVHGGPMPATTDGRFTAVGINSVKRWVRPVCFQNCPQHLLPLALQDDNVDGIWRMVNGKMER